MGTPAEDRKRRWRRRHLIELAGAAVALVVVGVAIAADTITDASLSGNVAVPSTVNVGSNSFTISVWAAGTIPADKTGEAVVVNKYFMATDGTITPSASVADSTTLDFTVDRNYSQDPPCGATAATSITGCLHKPFVVNATLDVAAGTPGNTTGTLVVSMTGSQGLTADTTPDSGYVKVFAPANTAPAVDAGGGTGYGGAEGSAISLDGTVTDPDAGDTVTTLWTYAAGAGVDAGATCSFGSAGSVDTTVTCTDDGTYTLTLTADDGVNDPVSDTATLTVTNVDPTATKSFDTSVDEGTAFSLALTGGSDAGTNDTLTYAFDCGDGSGYGAASATASASCPTTDNGTRSVKAKIIDDDSGFNEYTGSVNVNNVNPIVAAPTFSGAVDCRQQVTLSGISFSDPGTIDYPWAVSINWGDGSVDTTFNTNTQGAQSNRTHTYNTPGIYTATVTVRDKDSGEGSNTSSNTVTVNQAYTVGFLQPIDPSNPTKLMGNTFKSGRVVPVKATIYDVCTQGYVNDPTKTVSIVVKAGSNGTPGSQDALEVYADAGAANSNTLNFRWTSDATVPGGGFWIYNLDSKTAISGSAMLVGTSYNVDIFVGSARATKTVWAVLTPTK